ncbi:MAG: Zn-ribbon domain-containing OB-fold protein [Solirubrobacterales bacterium]
MSDPNLKYVLRDMGSAAREFYRRLAEGRLATTHCASCGELRFPPRERCAACGAATVWRELSGRGAVYAFTHQERGLRFTAPDVLGVIELEEGVRVFGLLEAPFESLTIGQPVALSLRRDVPGVTLLAFRPDGAANRPR